MKLVISNLDGWITKEQIEKKFSAFGPIINVEVWREWLDADTQTASVDFLKTLDCRLAVEALDGEFFDRFHSKSVMQIKTATGRKRRCHERYDKATLFLQNIDSNTTEAMLTVIFSSYGRVLDCEIYKDDVTGKTTEYGRVTFTDEYIAEEALYAVNGNIPGADNFPVFIERYPLKEDLEIARTLYVCNIDPCVTEESLRRHFRRFGKVRGIRLVETSTEQEKQKRFALITFRGLQMTETALQRNNHILPNCTRPLTVMKLIEKEEMQCQIDQEQEHEGEARNAEDPEETEDPKEAADSSEGRNVSDPADTLYIGDADPQELYVLEVENLAPVVTDAVLRKHFEQFGVVTKATIDCDKERGFVTFEKKKEGRAAKKATDKSIFKGQELRVRHFKQQEIPQQQLDMENEPQEEAYMLKVKNLPPEVTDAVLRGHFEQFGVVTKATVVLDKERNSLGFGFVNFADKAEGRAAKKATHKCTFMGEKLHVRKWKLEEELEKQFDNDAEREKEETTYVPEVENLAPGVTDAVLREHTEPFGVLTENTQSDRREISELLDDLLQAFLSEQSETESAPRERIFLKENREEAAGAETMEEGGEDLFDFGEPNHHSALLEALSAVLPYQAARPVSPIQNQSTNERRISSSSSVSAAAASEKQAVDGVAEEDNTEAAETHSSVSSRLGREQREAGKSEETVKRVAERAGGSRKRKREEKEEEAERKEKEAEAAVTDDNAGLLPPTPKVKEQTPAEAPSTSRRVFRRSQNASTVSVTSASFATPPSTVPLGQRRLKSSDAADEDVDATPRSSVATPSRKSRIRVGGSVEATLGASTPLTTPSIAVDTPTLLSSTTSPLPISAAPLAQEVISLSDVGTETEIVIETAEKEKQTTEKSPRRRSNRIENKSYYVCKVEILSPDVTDLFLKEFFQQFGVVTKAKVISDPKCKSSGFGFVFFPNKKEAAAAKKADKSIFIQKRIRILEWTEKIPERCNYSQEQAEEDQY